MDGKSAKEIIGSDKPNIEAELNARIDKLEQRVANLENAPTKTDAQGKVMRST
jgi:chaperonin cofactor prefoldin